MTKTRVKPLVWVDVDAFCTRQKAVALGGHYSVVEFDAGTDEAHYATNIDLGGLSFVFILEKDPMGGSRPKRYPTLEAAKAAAQADYEARVLSALDLTPDPAVQALVDALRPFADIFVGQNPDWQPLVRLDRDAILSLRAALATFDKTIHGTKGE